MKNTDILRKADKTEKRVNKESSSSESLDEKRIDEILEMA